MNTGCYNRCCGKYKQPVSAERIENIICCQKTCGGTENAQKFRLQAATVREEALKKRTDAFINQAAPLKPEIVNPYHFQARKHHNLKTVCIILLAFVIAGTAYGAYSFTIGPKGKLTSLLEGSETKSCLKFKIKFKLEVMNTDRKFLFF